VSIRLISTSTGSCVSLHVVVFDGLDQVILTEPERYDDKERR